MELCERHESMYESKRSRRSEHAELTGEVASEGRTCGPSLAWVAQRRAHRWGRPWLLNFFNASRVWRWPV